MDITACVVLLNIEEYKVLIFNVMHIKVACNKTEIRVKTKNENKIRNNEIIQFIIESSHMKSELILFYCFCLWHSQLYKVFVKDDKYLTDHM